MRWFATLLLGALAVVVISVPFAMAASAAAGDPLPLELFTSQSRTSCSATHINHWDSLGWRALFSLPEATVRQDTPQLVGALR